MSKPEFLGLSMAVLGVGVWLGGLLFFFGPLGTIIVAALLGLGGFAVLADARDKIRKTAERLRSTPGG